MSINRRSFIKTGLTAGLTAAMVRNIRLFGQDNKKVRLGFIGVGSRGTGHLRRILRRDDVEVPAICDIKPENLTRALDLVEKAKGYRPDGYSKNEEDFRRMVERDDMDGTIISTPWEWHTPMSVASMKAAKYAGVEVPAAVTIDECWELVKTYESTGIPCMILENVCYRRDVIAVLNMVRKGLFGEIIHCECGYQHDVRYTKFGKNGVLLWRGKHSVVREGDLYPTHGIGPIAECLDINRGNRFVFLTSTATKRRGLSFYVENQFGEEHPNVERNYALGDIVTTVIKCFNGETVIVSHDTNSYRPYSLRFRVQGTKGIWMKDNDSIYIRDRSPKEHAWEPFDKYQEEFDHPLWKKYSQNAAGAGHGGMDYFVRNAFIESIKRKVFPPIDVYDAVSWSVISPLSEQSIAKGSVPMEFPDFTRSKWITNKRIFGLSEEY